MQLLFLFSPNKLIYVVIFLAIGCIGNVKASSNDASNLQQVDNKTSNTVTAQTSVKKDLKVNIAEEIAPPQEKDDHTKETIIKNEKSLVASADKEIVQKSAAKAGSILETFTASTSSKSQHHQYLLDEDFVLNDEGDAAESLKTGFYFFLLLSSGAFAFIIFKIYRLRLSRAERKYGVQGDRSTQELTPLPTSVDDGHSDDEDQTVFEIQRQHIRIL